MEFYKDSYYLQPKGKDWETYPNHTPLIDGIFEIFMPFVNERAYYYLNFRRGTSVFENEVGDYMLIVYDMEEKDHPRIQEILVEIEQRDLESSQRFQKIIEENIQIPFHLEKVDIINPANP